MVALLLQRWLNYRGLLLAAKTEGENKESPTEFFFFQYQRQNIKTIKVTTRPSIQSVQRSHNEFLRPMKHDLAGSDEVARGGSLHEFVFTVLCMIYSRSDRALSLLDSFRHPICLNTLPGYLYGCLKLLISWSKLTKTNLLTVQWRFVEGLR